jgi:hypothetical protein
MFDWPIAYGYEPGRALRILVAGIAVFAGVYLAALLTSTGRIYRVFPAGRLAKRHATVRSAAAAEVERLRPSTWGRVPQGGLSL